MDQEKFKKINYELIETFLSAGKLCLDLRKEGLTEGLKKDSTPVTNGDLEVNKILVTNIMMEKKRKFIVKKKILKM